MSGNSEKIAIDDWMPSGLDEFVKLHLHHACATGFLLQAFLKAGKNGENEGL